MIFRPVVPPDREMRAENPAVHLARDGMDHGFDLQPSHFRDLVNRDPRRDGPSPPDRLAVPLPLAARQLEEGGQSPRRVEKGAGSYVGALEHRDRRPPCRVVAIGSVQVRLSLGDLSATACPKIVSSSSNFSVIATTPRHACNRSTCHST
jgi:hypothetical protein